jgi:excisionase family DNA binding protein
MTVQAQPLVTKAEAARVSGLSYSTIVRLVKRGVLTEVRIAPGMHPRLRLDDVVALGDRESG